MPNPSIEKEIITHLSKLPLEKQQHVYFARTLTIANLLGFRVRICCVSGTIEPGDLQVMARIIEEDCEKVNSDEW